MAVSIEVKGNKESDEYKDALVLKEIFQKGIPKEVNGKILIISNVTLFGQEVKDVDIIALGAFEKFSLNLKSRAKGKDQENKDVPDNEIKERLIFINDFCFVFECKKHRAEDIQLNGLTLLVKYNNKLSDVTHQSERQKYSLLNFFEDRLKYSPYIANFIWLRSVSWHSLKELITMEDGISTSHNYLPNVFSVDFLFQLACIQIIPFTSYDLTKQMYKGYSSFGMFMLKRGEQIDFERIKETFRIFERVKEGIGKLTRKKIEHITKIFLEDQKYAQAIGEKLLIISGRAGTGKTVRLLKIACDVSINKGARCLILTYNLALVSDIKRTLALAEIPDGVDEYTVNITTLHKFMYELFFGFGIGVNKELKENGKVVEYVFDFINNYEAYLIQLHDYLKEGIINEKDINELMRKNHDAVAWDYILIDEAQDWSDVEKDIIFSIFKKEKVMIADGVDQLVRHQKKCNWTRMLKSGVDFHKVHGRKGLRQKVNLVDFVNKVAQKVNINWEVEPAEELVGGKVIISVQNYNKSIHEQIYTNCLTDGNKAYEMLFLVPPNLVEKKGENRKFIYSEDFNKMGISLWDGTSTGTKSLYPTDLNQFRLLQYESCRGLEGWSVVCLDFDEFIKYRMESYIEENTTELELALESFEEKRDRFVYLWSVIPLTRAIDTLVITIKDKNSKIGKLLREIYEDNPDFVQWIE